MAIPPLTMEIPPRLKKLKSGVPEAIFPMIPAKGLFFPLAPVFPINFGSLIPNSPSQYDLANIVLDPLDLVHYRCLRLKQCLV